MNVRRPVVSLAAAALLCLGLAAAPAAAQSPAGVRVATASPARIFVEIQETKDLRQKLEQETAALQNEAKSRQQKVKDLQAARELLKPDSPQYAQAEQDFMREAIEFDTWTKITQAKLQGQQKQQMKQLFDKIVTATTEVAKQEGYDLVLADQRPELPENLGVINTDQLRQLLNQRNVLFASDTVDISPRVVQNLDSKYKAGGGAAAAPQGGQGGAPAGGNPAPAPAR